MTETEVEMRNIVTWYCVCGYNNHEAIPNGIKDAGRKCYRCGKVYDISLTVRPREKEVTK